MAPAYKQLPLMAKQSVQITGDISVNTSGFDSSLMGVVSGTGNLHKANAGRLALDGMNTFNGMVDVQAGSVALNNANSLGADTNSVMLANGTSLQTTAAVMAKQSVQITGDISVNTSGFDSSLMGVVSGTGQLVKEGLGSLTLTGSNSYAGGTTVNAGSLVD